MKTCNAGCCEYRLITGECVYKGYCDYQRPIDSRMQPIRDFSNYSDYCLCSGASNTSGDCVVCGKKKQERTER